jgi:iron complex outermembrane receptor protein
MVEGNLRRNERNLMWNVDPYVQTRWQLTDKLSLDAGLRYSSVWFDSNDHYITASNGDDSGDASYHKWLPAGSLKYALTDSWNLYAAAGRGFETPTINELSYRSGGQSGLNLPLSHRQTIPSKSAAKLAWVMAYSVQHSFAPIPITRLSPIPAAADAPLIKTPAKRAVRVRSWRSISSSPETGGQNWRGRIWMRPTAATSAATVMQRQPDPGIARNMGFASLGYVPEQGWYAGADVHYMSDIANDENTATAPSWTVVGLNTGYKFNYGNWMMDVFGRVDNLFDREYVGSVIVNESNDRYYEPAPGRNYGVGLSVAYRFE